MELFVPRIDFALALVNYFADFLGIESVTTDSLGLWKLHTVSAGSKAGSGI